MEDLGGEALVLPTDVARADQVEAAAQQVEEHFGPADRRELFVGYMTMVAVEGNKVAPGYADEYLAHNGVQSQQTNTPANPQQPDNLIEPVPRDFGTHGILDEVAHDRSWQVELSKHRRSIGMAVAGLLIGTGAAMIGSSSSSKH